MPHRKEKGRKTRCRVGETEAGLWPHGHTIALVIAVFWNARPDPSLLGLCGRLVTRKGHPRRRVRPSPQCSHTAPLPVPSGLMQSAERPQGGDWCWCSSVGLIRSASDPSRAPGVPSPQSPAPNLRSIIRTGMSLHFGKTVSASLHHTHLRVCSAGVSVSFKFDIV